MSLQLTYAFEVLFTNNIQEHKGKMEVVALDIWGNFILEMSHRMGPVREGFFLQSEGCFKNPAFQTDVIHRMCGL